MYIYTYIDVWVIFTVYSWYLNPLSIELTTKALAPPMLSYSVKNLLIAFIYKILLFSYTKGKSRGEEVYSRAGL
jgi:hypothetical protein